MPVERIKSLERPLDSQFFAQGSSKQHGQFAHLVQKHTVSLLVLICGVALSSGVTWQFDRTFESKDRERFRNQVERTQSSIEARLDTYIAMLRAGSGLFAASDNVTAEDFRAYVSCFNLENNFPGMQGIGWSERFSPAERNAAIKEARDGGNDDFKVWPEHDRPEYHAIVYLEPLDRRNQAALGFDMFSNAGRRAAMEQARDTASATASGKVTLVQEIDDEKQAGFLIYVPVYHGNEVPTTVEQRRAQLRGFVYSPFRSDDLFNGIFARETNPRIDFAVYDGTKVTPDALLYDSAESPTTATEPQFESVTAIEAAGRPWTVTFRTRSEFDSSSGRDVLPVVFFTGLLTTVALAMVTLSQTNAREAAEHSTSALRSSEERFRALVNGAPVAISVSRRGRNLYVNPAYRSVFKIREQDNVAGTSILDEIAPEEHEQILENVRRRYAGESVAISYEFTGVARDGARFPVQVVVGQIGLPDGLASLAFITDVTERKRIEGRTRFLLQLDDALRSLTDAHEITKTSARLLGEYLDVDRCAYADVEADENTFNLTGDYVRDVPSIVGRYTFTQFGSEALRLMRANEQYVVDDIDTYVPPPEDFAAYRLTKIQAVICVPLHKGGKFVAAMAVHQRTPRNWRDDEVSLVRAVASRSWESIERARVLRELREREQALQETDRRKDQFLATLAHELRNPLAPISNALQAWPLVEHDPNKVAELRTLMDRQVAQMTRLIDDLLDVSRISLGKIELRKQRIDLATVLQGAIEGVRPFVETCRHELNVRVPEDPVEIEGDPGRLMQVFGNLVHNAAKYTGHDGHITVSLNRQDGQAVISVADDGPGIPPDMSEQIFEMFTQVDQTLTRSHGGLGIGLTLVKTLVELHGGTVRAYSEGPGRGSEFIVRFPFVRTDWTEPFQPATRSSARDELPKYRILVVDDMKPSANTLAMMLKMLGQETTVRFDGPSAISTVGDFKPDLVISDIAMPGMDGYEVARQIRKRFGSSLTLVALTGYGQESDRRQALDAGFDHHLVKPTSVDSLSQLLLSLPPQAALRSTNVN